MSFFYSFSMFDYYYYCFEIILLFLLKSTCNYSLSVCHSKGWTLKAFYKRMTSSLRNEGQTNGRRTSIGQLECLVNGLWMACECLMNALWMHSLYIKFRIINNKMFYKITVQDESSGWLLSRFSCTCFNRFMMEMFCSNYKLQRIYYS